MNNIGIFGPGTGPIWLADVSCSGDETNLFSCPRNPLIEFDIDGCYHLEDAGVICPQGVIYVRVHVVSIDVRLYASICEFGASQWSWGKHVMLYASYSCYIHTVNISYPVHVRWGNNLQTKILTCTHNHHIKQKLAMLLSYFHHLKCC